MNFFISASRKLYYALPVSFRFILRRVIYWPSDIFSYTNRNSKLIPPKGLTFIGGGDFVKTGNRLFSRLVDYCDLKPNSSVLDIGCGIGRLALPLTSYLNSMGSYIGFDVVKFGVIWCSKNITKAYPNFTFEWVNLANDLYKKQGKNASGYSFPYATHSFDLVFAFSVFTHMQPNEVQQYLIESFRVLKPGGKAYFTFFVQNNKPLPKNFTFPIKHSGFALMSEKVKSANVLYEHNFLCNMIKDAGFEIKTVNPGKWNNDDGVDFQDAFVLIKPSHYNKYNSL